MYCQCRITDTFNHNNLPKATDGQGIRETFDAREPAMSSGIRLLDLPIASDRNEAWRLVRAAGDVVKGSDGVWRLTSPEAVQYPLRNHKLFSSARAFDGLMSPVPLIPLAIDRPDHKRYRRILDPMLAPAVINTMENELREQIRKLVREFADKGQCDIVTDLARVYPVQVFLTLFGLPLRDTERFPAGDNMDPDQAGSAHLGFGGAFINAWAPTWPGGNYCW